ncbi:hypothetical protein [Pyruvatibacter sp.]
MLDREQRRDLRAFRKAFSEFKEVSPIMTTAVIDMFLQVALTPGKSVNEYAELMGTPQSSASRHLLDLSIVSRTRNKEGHGLLTRDVNTENLQKNCYTLSPKGQRLVERILSA